MPGSSGHMQISSTPRSFLLLASLGIAPFFVNGYINSKIYESFTLYWSFELLTWIIIPLGVVFLTTKTVGFEFRQLGFHTSICGYQNSAALVLACVLSGPICYWIYVKTVNAVVTLDLPGGIFAYETIVPDSTILKYLVVVYFALSAGLVEEFLMRGMLFRAFRDVPHSSIMFLVISPVIFSLVHWEGGLGAIISTYIFGIFMAVAFLLLRNIWPLIVGHVYTNILWFSQ